MSNDKQDKLGNAAPIVAGAPSAPVVATAELSQVDKAVQALLDGVSTDLAEMILREPERESGQEGESEPEDEEDEETDEVYFDGYWSRPPQRTEEEIAEDARVKESYEAEMPAELVEFEEDYLKWREVLMVRMFNAKVWPDRNFNAERNGKKLDYEKEKAKWLSAIDNGEHYYLRDYPDKNYFKEKIAPLAIYMSKYNGADMKEVASHALLTFKKMMRLSTYHGTICKVQPGVIKNIFAIKHSGGSHGNNAGQYKYMYDKYGKWAAYAATVFQADVSDEHYDGMNYSRGTYKLEEIFGTVAKLVPEQYREFVFKGAVNYGGYRHSEMFMDQLPDVIKEIKEAGREDLLPLYFEFLEVAHSAIESNLRSFSIFHAGTVIAEMDALSKITKYKDEIFEAAKEMVRIGREYSSSPVPTFIDEGSEKEGDDLHELSRYAQIHNLPALLNKMEKSSCSEETIKKVLAIPKNYPILGSDAFRVMYYYERIEQNFPGGLEGLIKSFPQDKYLNRAQSRMIEIATSANYSNKDLELILGGGEEMMKLFGESSASYFQHFGDGIGALAKGGIKKFLSDPEKFKAAIKEISDIISKCGENFNGQDPRERILEKLCTNYGGENYEALAKGFKILIEKLSGMLRARTKDNEDKYGLFHNVSSYYCHLGFYLKGGGNDPDDNSGIDYETHAKVLLDFVGKQHFRSSTRLDDKFSSYINLVRNGLSPEISALIVMAETGQKGSLKAMFKKYQVSEGQTKDLFEIIYRARAIINKVDHGGSVNHAEIMSARKRMEELMLDPDLQEHLNKDVYLSELDRVARINFFKEACKIGIGGSEDLEKSGDLMRTTNKSTQMAVAGMSILLGAGAMEFENMEDGIAKLPVDSNASFEELGGILMNGRYEKILRENIAMVLPRLEQAIISERSRMPGLLPVGGKIHTKKPVNEEGLAMVEKMFGLPNGTAFKLIHANKTLLLPPLPSALEMQMLVKVLESFGVIDLSVDDLQICAAGRRPEENAAIVGSATLLSRNIGRTYADGAFETTHSQTGARIMAYDAGVKLDGMPFDSRVLWGRTDILGTQDLSDFGRYQVLSTMAAHAENGEIFTPLMRAFSQDYLEVLKRAGLDRVLNQSAWVFDNAKSGDDLKNHEGMVRRFTDKWMYASGRPDFGVIRDVKTLIGIAKGKIEEAAPVLIGQNREEFDRLLKY